MERSPREHDEDRDLPADDGIARDDGLARFEVEGLGADRALLRALARRLAEPGDGAAALRKTLASAVGGTESSEGRSPKRGGVLAALRRSPLVGADLDLTRLRVPEREIDL